MKRPQICLFLPSSMEDVQYNWIIQLPELQLLGDLFPQKIDWINEEMGSETDWRQLMDTIECLDETIDGVIIWAPEQSIIRLGGFLSLSFEALPFPVILFSAPAPSQLSTHGLIQLGLQSVLINAMYLAQSDLGEVVLLSGSSIFRPSQCYWHLSHGQKLITSKEEPLAMLTTKLTFLTTQKPRSTALKTTNTNQFNSGIDFYQWYPGIAQPPLGSTNAPFTMVQTTEAYWGADEFEAFRAQLRKTGKPLIWYSQEPWFTEYPAEHELFLSHPQEWWAILLAQFAFASQDTISHAFTYLKQKSL